MVRGMWRMHIMLVCVCVCVGGGGGGGEYAFTAYICTFLF